MIRFPNAKINLGLSIVRKREDGYHDLETVFYPVNICDILEVVPNDKGDICLYSSGLAVTDNIEDNLIVKAYRLMRKHHDVPGVDVHFKKQIPFGAGMGGGSSDASFMLKLLRDLFLPHVSDLQLEALALTIGADCPFFIQNKPVFAEGVGERFTPVDFSLRGYDLMVVKADVHVSTKDAFSKVVPSIPHHRVKDVVVTQPVEKWKDLLLNDFERSVFSLHPQLSEIKEELYRQGAVYVSMSGSGSAIYALLNEGAEMDLLPFAGCYIWQGKCEY